MQICWRTMVSAQGPEKIFLGSILCLSPFQNWRELRTVFWRPGQLFLFSGSPAIWQRESSLSLILRTHSSITLDIKSLTSKSCIRGRFWTLKPSWEVSTPLFQDRAKTFWWFSIDWSETQSSISQRRSSELRRPRVSLLYGFQIVLPMNARNVIANSHSGTESITVGSVEMRSVIVVVGSDRKSQSLGSRLHRECALNASQSR